MFDIATYNRKRDLGLASLIKAGDTAYAIATRKFDPETGAELAEEVIGVNLEEVQTSRDNLQAQLDAIDGFLAECNNIESSTNVLKSQPVTNQPVTP